MRQSLDVLKREYEEGRRHASDRLEAKGYKIDDEMEQLYKANEASNRRYSAALIVQHRFDAQFAQKIAAITEIANDIRDTALAVANEQYLEPHSDHSRNILDEADSWTNRPATIAKIENLGFSAKIAETIFGDLDQYARPEIRAEHRGTGNFNEADVIYWHHLGEITDTPEWSDHDLDSEEWKAAVAIVQASQLELGRDQQFGIAENGEIHFDFEAYVCLVIDRDTIPAGEIS